MENCFPATRRPALSSIGNAICLFLELIIYARTITTRTSLDQVSHILGSFPLVFIKHEPIPKVLYGSQLETGQPAIKHWLDDVY